MSANEFRDDDAGYRAWTTGRRIHESQPAVWNSVGRERQAGRVWKDRAVIAESGRERD
jgi:hypothetical protein